jgi:hypothetical protein
MDEKLANEYLSDGSIVTRNNVLYTTTPSYRHAHKLRALNF